jgi:phenylacetate-CoA ligase
MSFPLDLFRRTAEHVPAYRAFLEEHGVDPASVKTLDDFARLPLVTKENYVAKYPLSERCRTGDVADNDMIAFSSGSTGEPTLWPRTIGDEEAVASRFEHVFRNSFRAHERRTLAVVAFPLGTWVGGMYTTSCTRLLAKRGLKITTVTPGNDRGEILRVVRALSPMFDQTVLLGYPPFLKDVIDAGRASHVPWNEFAIRTVLAGEVFSEEWRSLVGDRTGSRDVLHDSASLYGTADAGVLGTETPLSISIRRFAVTNSNVFESERLPTLVQYDPTARHFETHENTLVVTADGGAPLVRYHIADDGGVMSRRDMLSRVRALGFEPHMEDSNELPFVWVYGRSHFAISFYGANVFPEMISVGLEQPEVRAWVTGKFVMESRETSDKNRRLAIAVELAPGVAETGAMHESIANAILVHLRRTNSEFSHYVPADAQRPDVSLYSSGDPTWFPAGVKHRYVRQRK